LKISFSFSIGQEGFIVTEKVRATSVLSGLLRPLIGVNSEEFFQLDSLVASSFYPNSKNYAENSLLFAPPAIHQP